jgi:hypothetical protein
MSNENGKLVINYIRNPKANTGLVPGVGDKPGIIGEPLFLFRLEHDCHLLIFEFFLERNVRKYD